MCSQKRDWDFGAGFPFGAWGGSDTRRRLPAPLSTPEPGFGNPHPRSGLHPPP